MITSLYNDHFNKSWSNITESFNSSLSDTDNTNASRHFADDPQLEDIFHAFPMTIIFIVSAVPCGLIIIGSVIFWLKDCTRSNGVPVRSSRTETDDEGSLSATCRPDLLSIVQNGVADRILFENGDEFAMIDTPSSIYPSDMLPNYTDASSARNPYSDTITTPLSNNSVITMIMRNNHLIIETEERVPVNCAVLTREDLYRSKAAFSGASFLNAENGSFQDLDVNDLLDDDMNNYSEEDFSSMYTIKREEASRREFHEPTTSRQADEEDEHVEFFHKNISSFRSPGEREFRRNETETVASCSRNVYEVHRYSSCELATTGFTQSDLTGSSSSTSGHARTNYTYTNQCEYVLFNPQQQRKRSSSLNVLTTLTNDNCTPHDAFQSTSNSAIIFREVDGLAKAGNSLGRSVHEVTDCSSPDFYGPSK